MDSNPDCVPYGEPAYWDYRYNQARQKEGLRHTFDWYATLEELWPIIETYCGENTGFRILYAGCGSSNLPEELYKKGFKHITCIDISATLIGHLQHRNQGLEGIEYLAADARSLTRFDDNSFDIVIEKGMIDALFSGVMSYNSVLQANQEIFRVLKQGCNFVSVSCGAPKVRMPHFNHSSLDWEVDHSLLLRRPQTHIYIMTKSPDAPERYVPDLTDIVDNSLKDDRVMPTFDSSVHVSSVIKDSNHTGFIKLNKIRDADDLLRGYSEGRIRLNGPQKGSAGI